MGGTIEKYLYFIETAKKKAYGVRIKFGLEVCYIPKISDLLDSILQEYKFDLLTGSVHYIAGWGFDHKTEFWKGINVDKALYNHLEKRAEDLMLAFADKSIKAIFSCIGGYESVRLLPYIDFDVIRNNPKIFIGYSDTTVTHMMCYKAWLSSFYGPSILAEFAENVEMFDYTKHWVEKVLFDNSPIGTIELQNQ